MTSFAVQMNSKECWRMAIIWYPIITEKIFACPIWDIKMEMS